MKIALDRKRFSRKKITITVTLIQIPVSLLIHGHRAYGQTKAQTTRVPLVGRFTRVKEHFESTSSQFTRVSGTPVPKHMGVEVRYPCETCGKSYSDQNTLRIHIKSVHEGVKYPCVLCFKIYSDMSALRRHIISKHQQPMTENQFPTNDL